MNTFRIPSPAALQIARDTILRKPIKNIGIWQINPMEWKMIDRIAGVPEGTYQKAPVPTYRTMLENSGVCMLDQWIPNNPLSMQTGGYEASQAGSSATTGLQEVVCDGIRIDSPEAVVEHLERFIFPKLERGAGEFNAVAVTQELIAGEAGIQAELGPNMLKAPYGWPFSPFPVFKYDQYGYENYFMAYSLYPEVMEKLFRLQADFAAIRNRTSARAIRAGNLPPYARLDSDMADGRSTLVDIASLDRIWFPHFARSIQPLVEAGINLLWHCDGNLSAMVPRLIACGVRGFQGFQYEHGMDYEKICAMKTRDGEDLLIIGGVSVTRTLPHGTPDDVKKEMQWLVRNGPKRGLFLGASSSIAPGVPWGNLEALIEGFWYYREHGRD